MPSTDEGLALWRQVQLMHWQLSYLLHRGLVEDVGISYQDFIVLSELSVQARRVLDLARVLGLEKSRLSHHLNRMAERGLITKQPAPGDRRGALIVTTTAGRRLHRRALPGHLERVHRTFTDHVTNAEAKAIRSVTSKIRASLPP
jgi:DNA-binding MarR family transcriptional regulator